MMFKIVECLSRDIVDGGDAWAYAWKEWVGVGIHGKTLSKHEHRFPWFLSLHAHLRLEECLEDLSDKSIYPKFLFKPLQLPYDIIHGFICGYSMREILSWWRSRHDGFVDYVDVGYCACC
jgi:hypothetical protein